MGDVPYPHLKNEGQVIYALVQHESPRDPDREFERTVRRNLLLSFCEECWRDQKTRPGMRSLANGLKTDRDLTGSVRLLEPVRKIMDRSIRAIYGERRIDGEIERVAVKRFFSVEHFDDSYYDGRLNVSKQPMLFLSVHNLWLCSFLRGVWLSGLYYSMSTFFPTSLSL